MTGMSRPAVRRGRARASIAGVVAAGAALGTGELVTGLGRRGPSLVTAVGSRLIDALAASLKDLAVALFGTHDKTALVIGIVLVSLGLGAVIGVVAHRRAVVGDVAFVGFGLVGWLAYRSDPLARPVVGLLAVIAAVAVGAGVLRVLLRIAEPSGAAADAVGATREIADGVAGHGGSVLTAPRARIDAASVASRRRFIAASAAVGGAATAAAVTGRRARGVAAPDRAAITLPAPVVAASTSAPAAAVDGISPFITPTERFYRIDTALGVPRVDLSSWRLSIAGMVDRPLSLSFDDLLALDSVEEIVTLQCVSNEVGGDLVGTARWQGVPLASLLERAGVHADASQVVGRSVDRWTAGFPTDVVREGRTALVAYAMNGEPLPARHGFPARLVVAGLYGYVSATKWLERIELTTWDGFDGYWIPRGWSKNGPIKTASRIDVPRAGAPVSPGPTTIAGVAWAPPRGIRGVQVQIDDGPWIEATVGGRSSGDAWVQWWLPWDAMPGTYVVRVRAIDGDGVAQSADVRPPDPDGATGLHSRRIVVAGSR